MTLTAQERERAELLLIDAQVAQHKMWDKLNELEQILGFDVTGDDICEGQDLDDLIGEEEE
jgi:hypothetical protein